jgi:hypothetical protein
VQVERPLFVTMLSLPCCSASCLSEIEKGVLSRDELIALLCCSFNGVLESAFEKVHDDIE